MTVKKQQAREMWFLKDHQKWKLWYLKLAKVKVKNKEWLNAGEAYRVAAYHEAVVRAIKAMTKSKPRP